nr:hypothetical protein Iba_chr07dCG6160 [Ipomoea batatas]
MVQNTIPFPEGVLLNGYDPRLENAWEYGRKVVDPCIDQSQATGVTQKAVAPARKPFGYLSGYVFHGNSNSVFHQDIYQDYEATIQCFRCLKGTLEKSAATAGGGGSPVRKQSTATAGGVEDEDDNGGDALDDDGSVEGPFLQLILVKQCSRRRFNIVLPSYCPSTPIPEFFFIRKKKKREGGG